MEELLSNVSDRHYLISVEEISLLKEIFNRTERESWAYFAPFLACYSLPPKRPLYLTKSSDFFCLFQYSRRANIERIDLVIPPSMLTTEVKIYLLKMKDLLQQKDMRILWIDSSDVCALKDLFGRNIQIQEKEDEYIYDPKVVFELSGKRYKDARKRINNISKKDPVFFELEEGSEIIHLVIQNNINESNILITSGIDGGIKTLFEVLKEPLQDINIEIKRDETKMNEEDGVNNSDDELSD